MCKKITGKHYKKVALVHLGDPPADFAREQQKKFQVIQQKTLDMNVQTERTKLNKERADKRVEAQKKYHHAKSAWDEKKNKDPEFDEPEPDQPMLEEDVPVDEAIPDRIAELDPNVKLKKNVANKIFGYLARCEGNFWYIDPKKSKFCIKMR